MGSDDGFLSEARASSHGGARLKGEPFTLGLWGKPPHRLQAGIGAGRALATRPTGPFPSSSRRRRSPVVPPSQSRTTRTRKTPHSRRASQTTPRARRFPTFRTPTRPPASPRTWRTFAETFHLRFQAFDTGCVCFKYTINIFGKPDTH